MRSAFSLFRSHLDFAHEFWKKLVLSTDTVVDATCGNGHDSLFLVELVHKGKIFLFDIQEDALKTTSERIKGYKEVAISFHQMCHSAIDEVVPKGGVKLIVYNLGYLPGQNKSLTTVTKTTLISVKKSLSLVCPGGVISLTCYPGHEEGQKELEALSEFCRELDPKEWSVSRHMWVNRALHPEIFFIQRSI